ncbi:MAG: bifunctional DNA-formamidopyrimidine glycosylase/DNA-(apurinic or apyrimidinic site) lyase [Candidatus Accumulibacter sp.]|jgi:formamidopyrimidine-DNA glycosylase|nr:bifunctional DNA-formamidopyrimidine glycosylase/DNA-(apurinic or apyrimidinic site) lyase [Accumulibacter sp.]
MPELPEVEVSRLGLLPHLEGQAILRAVFRVAALRWPVAAGLAERLAGRRVRGIGRRGKYLVFDCADAQGRGGALIVHLGMSGSLRLVANGTPPEKHDHADIVFRRATLRLRDPRRFGALLWHEGEDFENHPALAGLGIEPLSPEFGGDWLYAATRGARTPIKPWLMDARRIVGIGNIYAAEALFAAGINPVRIAGRLGRERCRRLAEAIRSTLQAAIAAGGSSVRDYVHSDGGAGSFQLMCAVYGRAHAPCPACGAPIRVVRQGGRSTFYCPGCQR